MARKFDPRQISVKRSLDIIVRTILKLPHDQMAAQGYKFICAAIDLEHFQSLDCEVATDRNELVGSRVEGGMNFYEAPLSPAEPGREAS